MSFGAEEVGNLLFGTGSRGDVIIIHNQDGVYLDDNMRKDLTCDQPYQEKMFELWL